MKPDEVKDNDRYYCHAGDSVGHVVFDTFFQKPQNAAMETRHIYTFCKSTFDYGSNRRESTWGSQEEVLVDGVSLCETCDRAFQEYQPKPNTATSKGIDLLRDVLKDDEI